MIDFDQYKRDLQALICDATLDVFRRSYVLRSIQTAQAIQTQALYDAVVGALIARTIDGAVGAQLDVIGRIVGRFPRPTQDLNALGYFSPDVQLLGPDWSGAYVRNAPLASQTPITDDAYRTAIRVQIAKNHVKYGSAPEIIYFARLAYGVDVSIRNVGSSDVELRLPPSTPPNIAAALVDYYTDETADIKYNLPLPTTARIRRVGFYYEQSFGPDRYSTAPDVAPVGVGYAVNT